MARYEWTDTPRGRRYGRIQIDANKASATLSPKAVKALTALKKDELVELAEKQGIDTAGLKKAEIAERLNG